MVEGLILGHVPILREFSGRHDQGPLDRLEAVSHGDPAGMQINFLKRATINAFRSLCIRKIVAVAIQRGWNCLQTDNTGWSRKRITH